ncbi:hypothetical protein CPB86DRAFT_703197 [Serendipita vermifera]|nr:hypothetical protein CPB86DRAFT_703197 [Serendipita vermifera]
MALAAQPPMHFPSGSNPHDLSWDESIVPTLRQRLQNESQILSKRLSTHSISSSSGADVAKIRNNTKAANNAATGRQSAIPRPSLSQDRKDLPTTTTTTKRRQRTNSTPFESQIPATPPTERPTRIPKVSAKGTSASNSYHPYKSATLSGSLNGSGSITSKTRGKVPDFMEPPSPFDPQFDTATSGSGSTRGTRQGGAKGVRSYIRDEEPPFPNSASTSTEFHYEQTRLLNSSNNTGYHSRMGTMNSSIDDSRPSGDGNPSDSDRPFEHWYRGEAARNGGVGELKIGRKEMLDIAQFGHKPRPTYDRSSPLGMHTTGGLRRRAGSVDEKRESWIMDENAYKMSKVIDESPLTDLEGDEYTTEGERAYPYPGKANGDIGLAIDDSMGGSNLNDYTMSVDDDVAMSTTPTAERTMAASYPSHTSANSQQSQKENQSSSRQASSAAGNSGKIPLGANNGAKASSTASPSSKPGATGPAKAKAKAKATPRKLSRTEEEKQSQEGADTADAPPESVQKIPYRLPPAKGNWDDIVLPAVTKKMGIEGYGLKSEGGDITEISEEVRKRMSVLHPPVPGLFGYDMAKYRPPEEDINMAVLNVSQPSPPSTPKANAPSLPPAEELAMRTEPGRDSPLAFSHYQANLPPVTEKNAKRKSAGIPAITISPPSADEHAKHRPEEDKNSGCCGCVIM